MMSTQNSCSPIRKAISSRTAALVWVSVMSARELEFGRGGRAAADAGDDGVDVEDQGDAAVTQDGGGGDARHLLVVGLQALDHDLALALDGVDHQGGAGA